MGIRATLAAGVLLAVLAAAPAQAQTTLPVGEAEGVTATARADGVVRVTFTKRAARLYKLIAGKRIEITCWILDAGDNTSQGGGEVFRAPKRRSSFLAGGGADKPWDYCAVRLASADDGSRPLVAVPLTQSGAVFLDERDTAVRVYTVLNLALLFEFDEARGAPTFDELRAAVPARVFDAYAIVPLAAPGDTPAPGKTGYYSDGDQHAAAVSLTASGRRFFFEYDADDVIRTNIFSFILNGYE